MKQLFLAAAFAVFAFSTNAQTADNGSIKYKLELAGVDDPQAQQMFKDANMEIGFMKDQYRMSMTMPMMTTRSYSLGDSSLVLMDIMNNKMMMTVSKDEVNANKVDETTYDVTETKDTKKIAGYQAKKYIVKTKDNETFTVYATDKLPVDVSKYSPYTKIKGTPLEYDVARGPYKLQVTATEVTMGGETKEKYVYDTTGYARTTMAQMKGLMGGPKHEPHGHDHSDPNHKH